MRSCMIATCSAGLLLLAAVAASGQTFSYSDNFNNAPEEGWQSNTLYNPTGLVPAGWRPYCTTDPNWVNSNIPRMYRRDNWGWAVSPFNATGQSWHDYGLPWCGTAFGALDYHNGRISLNNPWFSYEGERRSAMWFVGDTYKDGVSGDIYPRHWTGTYPMNLRTNGMKASFDIVIRTGNGGAGQYSDGTYVAGDGILFSVQPAGGDLNPWPGSNQKPAQYYSYGSGDRLGEKALPGFSVEFDTFPNANDPGYVSGSADTAQPFDTHNHVGIDVGISDADKSLATNTDAPFASSIVDMKKCGDNNQPVHVTVFYNDPAQAPGGALGYVRVYMYVDPAQASATPYMTDQATPNTNPPLYDPATLAFGMDGTTPKNGGLGELVCEACVGQFPGDSAIFGFLGHEVGWGPDSVLAFDNVNVQTYTVQGTACTPTWQPAFNPDPQNHPVTLSAAPLASTAANCSSPGWNVQTYPVFSADNNNPDDLKQAIAYCDAHGLASPVVSGEPNITYTSDGAPANLSGWRLPPGLTAGKWNDYFGLVCNGYIYFPQAGTFSLAINSDDGVQIKIGGQLVLDCPNAIAGTGLDAGYIINLTVPTAGVYPIQLIYEDYCCGDVLEFYRRTGNPMEEYVAIGVVTGGLSDQPVIYGLFNGGMPAKDLDSAPPYAGGNIVDATLAPAERAGAATDVSGSQVFNIKTIWAPNRWIYGGWGGWIKEYVTMRDLFFSFDTSGRETCEGWFDVLQNRAVDGSGNALTTADITYNRTTYDYGTSWFQVLADWEALPAYPPQDTYMAGGTTSTVLQLSGSQYAVRFEGYAVLEAKDYWIGVVGGHDHVKLQIGNQIMQTTGWYEDPGRLVKLHVTVPGAYPIRVETQHGQNNGFDNDNIWNNAAGGAILYEVTPGHARVPLNSAASSIKVYQNCVLTGAYVEQKVEQAIPPAAKVALNGQGGEPGWNGKVATPIDNPNRTDGNGVYDVYDTAHTTALIENNLYYYGPDSGGGPVANEINVGTSLNCNLWSLFDSPAGSNDFGNGEGYPKSAVDGSDTLPRMAATKTYWHDAFPTGNVISKSGQRDREFAASFTGYIEFPAAGDYAFNINSQDGAIMWIGGVNVLTQQISYWGWCRDAQPTFVHVSAPGLYDIRVDFFTQNWNAVLGLFQYLPDGSDADINMDPRATVQVYRSLATGVNPLTTAYANPVVLDVNTIAGPVDAGSEAGFHVQVVNTAYTDPLALTSCWWGQAHGNFYTWTDSKELLANVLDNPSYPAGQTANHPGTKVFDDVVSRVAFTDNGDVDPFPSTLQPDAFAIRVTGYLALKAGGHMFCFSDDDGVEFVIGGRQWKTGPSKGTWAQDACYVYAPRSGLYPYTLTYMQVDGGKRLLFGEITDPINHWWENPSTAPWGLDYLNTATSPTRAYVTVCHMPADDFDADGDVDQADFGAFQSCYTGPASDQSPPLPGECKCFDRTGDGAVDAADYNVFFNCLSGPTVPWTPTPDCQR